MKDARETKSLLPKAVPDGVRRAIKSYSGL